MSEKSSSSSGRIGVFGLLGIVFVTLKLTGFIDWSWWLVTAPFWGGVALALGLTDNDSPTPGPWFGGQAEALELAAERNRVFAPRIRYEVRHRAGIATLTLNEEGPA